MAKTKPLKQPPGSLELFYRKALRNGMIAFALITLSLLAGMEGYHYFENMPWVDALLNAYMILGGMGPVDPVKTFGGKLFASFYALYSGLLIIGIMGLLLGIMFHRILHQFHETHD